MVIMMMSSSSSSRCLRSCWRRLLCAVGSVLLIGCTLLCEINGFEPIITTLSFTPSGRQHHRSIPATPRLSPLNPDNVLRSNNHHALNDRPLQSHRHHQRYASLLRPLTASKSNLSDNEDNDGPGIVVNPLYFIPWVGFFVYAFCFSPGNVMDGTDSAIIQSFLSDPTNTSGAINPLYFVVFNALGIMPLVVASIVLPQGRSGGGWFGAGPFLLASLAAGYFSLGGYLSFRPPPVPSKTRGELSWPTRYIFENKLYNWSVVILAASLPFTSGLVFSDPATMATVVEDYIRLASTSKLVTNSSLDLVILTFCAATLIPRDYRLRHGGGGSDDGNDEARSSITTMANLVAASTVVLPVVGAALYCAFRPPLPEE
jgi:hypothetical protein